MTLILNKEKIPLEIKRVPMDSDEYNTSHQLIIAISLHITGVMNGQNPCYFLVSRCWRQLFIGNKPFTIKDIEDVYGLPRLDNYYGYNGKVAYDAEKLLDAKGLYIDNRFFPCDKMSNLECCLDEHDDLACVV